MSIEICEKHGLSFDSDFYSECIECENEEAESDEIQEDTTFLEEKLDAIDKIDCKKCKKVDCICYESYLETNSK